ncbi:MAG: right-handed parallel beta-helix repeat-containing protein [Candidatus Bathyarchaeota archaeon]|nr:right-handed parallel beta-helix repeat-containing protein [Candidatus Bathyarchaeota archaeon]
MIIQGRNNIKGIKITYQIIILIIFLTPLFGALIYYEHLTIPEAEHSTFIIYKLGTSYISQKSFKEITSSGSDATSVIQKTINSMNSGDTIKFRSASYPILHTIIGKSNIRIEGIEGVVWNCSSFYDDLSVFIFNGMISNADEATSSITDSYEGAYMITVSSPSGFALGDMVMIYTNAVWKNNERLQKQGEIRWITGISDSNFILDQRIEDTYLSDDNATIQKINPIKDVTISHLKFVGRIGEANMTCLEFEGASNITITGCTFEKFENVSLLFHDVVNSEVTNNTFIKSYMDGNGYGVDIEYACQNILVEYNVGHECRHMIAIGGGGEYPGGIPRHLILRYNKSYDSAWNSDKGKWLSSGAAFDSHNVGEDVNYLNNEAYNGLQGINCSFYTGVISGNKIYNVHNLGISLGANSATYSENVVVSNNLIQKTGAMGIYVHEPNVLIENNEIYDAGWAGIKVWDKNLPSLSGIKIHNNTIKGSGSTSDNYYSNIEINNAINPEIWNNTIRKIYLDTTKRSAYGILITGPLNNNGNLIAGCIGANIHDNDLTTAGQQNIIKDNGSGTVLKNNIGYP